MGPGWGSHGPYFFTFGWMGEGYTSILLFLGGHPSIFFNFRGGVLHVAQPYVFGVKNIIELMGGPD